MSESLIISTADRNTLAVADDTLAGLRELGRKVEYAEAEAKVGRALLQVAATSEKPADREKAYKVCRTAERSARAAFELAVDVDNDAGTLRAMSHNLAYNHDE
jgi:hypothetical protein